jgi:tetratricopeptide (TPR) repeat protein
MIHRTRWLGIIPLILCVAAVLIYQHSSPERDIWHDHKERGALYECTGESFSADAVATVQMAHEALTQARWVEAAALTPAGEIARSHVPLVWAVTYFVRALGATRMGQTVRARQDLVVLRLLRDGLVTTRQSDWAAYVELLFQVAAACTAQKEEKLTEALQHMYAAAALEARRASHRVLLELMASAQALLGEMLLERGEVERAAHVFEMAIATTPHRSEALYRAARAAELRDDLAKAQWFYGQMLARTDATTDPLQVAQARAFLANLRVILP